MCDSQRENARYSPRAADGDNELARPHQARIAGDDFWQLTRLDGKRRKIASRIAAHDARLKALAIPESDDGLPAKDNVGVGEDQAVGAPDDARTATRLASEHLHRAPANQGA
jgi:hypothetical protein